MSDAQIFQIIGIFYCVMGVGMFANQDFYRKAFGDFAKSKAAVLAGGMLALLLGCIMILLHNTWEQGTGVIITIFGWLALLKGIFILVAPKFCLQLIAAICKEKSILKMAAVLIFLLGIGAVWLANMLV